jgi:hypothetical protein
MHTASAAPADKMVLGIELGTRFVVPTCSAREVTVSGRLCFNGDMIDRKTWGADEYYVSIPSAGTPPYVRGELKVSVLDGIVESVQIGTWGIEAQWAALASFTKKYGEPTRRHQQMQPGLRSRLPAQFAEWDFEDFSIRIDGTTGSIDWGRIEVTTHRYLKRIKDYERQPPRDASK